MNSEKLAERFMKEHQHTVKTADTLSEINATFSQLLDVQTVLKSLIQSKLPRLVSEIQRGNISGDTISALRVTEDLKNAAKKAFQANEDVQDKFLVLNHKLT